MNEKMSFPDHVERKNAIRSHISRAERKVTDDGGDASFIGTEHKSYDYNDKPVERSVA